MYCSKCGGELSDAAAFCPRCGQPAGVLSPAVPAAIAPGAPRAVARANYPGMQYAGFWLRFVAYLIDGAIMLAGFGLILVPLLVLTGLGSALGRIRPDEEPGDAGVFLILLVVFGFIGIANAGTWLYHALMESSSWQATVGKKLLSLRVTDLAGQPVSFGRATGRHFAKLITNLIPLGIGYILAGFTERRQAIHDMIARCLVLRQG